MGNTKSASNRNRVPPAEPAKSSSTGACVNSIVVTDNITNSPSTSTFANPKKEVPTAESDSLDYVVASKFVNRHCNRGDTHLEKLVKSLDAFRQHFVPAISDCFLGYESLQKDLPETGVPERNHLMSEQHKFASSVCSKEEPVRIAFFGATDGGGETSLINSLCGQRILPMQDGENTARICVLKYADPENACIRSAKVVDGRIVTGEVLESLTNLTPPGTVVVKPFPHLDRSALLQGLSVDDYTPDIFFANIGVGINNIADELNGDPNLITDDAVLRIYDRHLKQMLRSPATRSFTIPDDFQKCMSFCCVSAHDLMCNKPSSKFTHGLFMDKLLHWIVATQQRRCCMALAQICTASGAFFRNLTALPTFCEEIQKEEATKQTLLSTKESILAEITECTQQLPFLLKQKVQQVQGDFLREAVSLPFKYEPNLHATEREQAEYYLLDKLRPWLKVNVTHPVIDEVCGQIQKIVYKNFRRSDTEDVDVLQLTAGYDAKMHRYVLTASLGLLCIGAVAVVGMVVAPFTAGASLGLCFAGMGVGSAATGGSLALNLFDSLLATKHADDDFKKLAAQQMLDSVLWAPKELEAQRAKLETVASRWVEELIKGGQNQVTTRGTVKRIVETCPRDKIQSMRLKFGQLYARTLDIQSRMLQDQPDLINSPALYPKESCIREGILEGNPVFVKVVDLCKCNESEQREFFEDLHHWSYMAPRSSNILPLHMVFQQQADVWCVVYPRFTYSLREHLERHILTMTLADVLVIARNVIAALRDLHHHKIVHSNLRLETIVVTTENNKMVRCAVAGFSTITGDFGGDEGHDTSSTNSCVSSNRLFCTPKDDIFAFGVILSELTPKPTLRRCLATTAGVAPQLPTARGTPPQLVNLIDQCVATDPDLRPTAHQVHGALVVLCNTPLEMLPLNTE
ncbi:hypothetical protein Pelo_7646 [Pelomyxa schiedti]|nr:hypothetical protein Pelo_7646 [Pelomyxa schiedti]